MRTFLVEITENPTVGLDALTARQKTVLKMIALSQTVEQIGLALKISSRTAEYHRAQLYKKLSVPTGDVAGLTRFAIRSGLITA
jgi:DNA-binding CsgD family transcriptional regulator